VREPGETASQPVLVAASLMYSLPVAQEMNFQAASAFLVVFGIAHAQVHSQPEYSVLLTGA
jgi:hypothetical protein